MHFTKIVTKDGREYLGPIWRWRPWLNWVSIRLYGETVEEKIFSFDDIKSMVTEGARETINCPLEGETRDELERARKDLKNAREFGWDGFDKNTPLYDWEKV